MSNHTPESGKQYPISPDREKTTGSGDEARAAAREATERTKAEAARTGEQLKHQGEEIASMAKDKAEGFAQEQKEAGASGIDSVARAVNKAADELEDTAPDLARHARDAASQVHAFSDRLREKSIGGMVDDLSGYARREPAAFFGVAVVAGFALSRFLGARTEREPYSDRRYETRSARDLDRELDEGFGSGTTPGMGSATPGMGTGMSPNPVNRNDLSPGRPS